MLGATASAGSPSDPAPVHEYGICNPAYGKEGGQSCFHKHVMGVKTTHRMQHIASRITRASPGRRHEARTSAAPGAAPAAGSRPIEPAAAFELGMVATKEGQEAGQDGGWFREHRGSNRSPHGGAQDARLVPLLHVVTRFRCEMGLIGACVPSPESFGRGV